jgi:hypothetical protein
VAAEVRREDIGPGWPRYPAHQRQEVPAPSSVESVNGQIDGTETGVPSEPVRNSKRASGAAAHDRHCTDAANYTRGLIQTRKLPSSLKL